MLILLLVVDDEMFPRGEGGLEDSCVQSDARGGFLVQMLFPVELSGLSIVPVFQLEEEVVFVFEHGLAASWEGTDGCGHVYHLSGVRRTRMAAMNRTTAADVIVFTRFSSVRGITIIVVSPRFLRCCR